jgi:hypothetical protein
MLLAVIMIIGAFTALTSCGGKGGGGDTDPCAEGHTYNPKTGKCTVCREKCKHDYKDDNVCDICGFTKKDTETGGGDDYPEVPWADDDPIELFFMMSDNSSNESLPSGCNRYLAGGDKRLEEAIDIDVEERNASAEYLTNVKLKYDYYPEAPEYNWSKCYELISTTIGTTGCPDMFCNFTYDMVAASLRSSFANLRDQDLNEGNFFSFLDEDYDEEVDNRGYMYEYMTSVTLSNTKMYLLASDYFLDLIRAFYIVPVNIKLLTDVGMEVTGDLNEDGKFNVEDFYEEIRHKDWDYKKVAAYSEKIYNNDNKEKAGEDLGDTLGWVLHMGFVSSGLIYSTDITVIDRSQVDENGNTKYVYPKSSPQLYELFDKCAELVNSTGVYVFSKNPESPNYDGGYINYGSTEALAVRKRFCENKLLFGGLIMLGGLEYKEYQVLKESSGFGVAPVPFYHEVAEDSEERYLTSIHNAARPGAIARTTKNFTACTAFLDYQSTHSTDILNNYYDRNLCLSVVDGSVDGTVEMLQYIRKNVRTAFDKTFEDAIGVYGTDTSIRWSHILETKYYDYDIRTQYKSLADKKEEILITIKNAYQGLP